MMRGIIYKNITCFFIVINCFLFMPTAYAEEADSQTITITFLSEKSEYAEVIKSIQIQPGETVEFPPSEDKSEWESFGCWEAYDDDGNYLGEVNENTKFYQSVHIVPHYYMHMTQEEAEIVMGKNDGYIVELFPGMESDYDHNSSHYFLVPFDETRNLLALLKERKWLEPKGNEGYTFVGWFTEEVGGEEIDDNAYVTSDMKIYARWKKDDGVYRLIYVYNYDTNADFKIYNIEWCSKVSKLPKLAREGYTFTGWYDGSDNPSIPINEIKKNEKISRTTYIYAHWEKINVKKASIKKVKAAGKNKIKVSIKKVKNADGYQIMCSKNKKFKKKTSKTYTSKKTTKEIKIKKNMKYIKGRAYRIDSAGKKVYGKWSKAKRIKSK